MVLVRFAVMLVGVVSFLLRHKTKKSACWFYFSFVQRAIFGDEFVRVQQIPLPLLKLRNSYATNRRYIPPQGLAKKTRRRYPRKRYYRRTCVKCHCQYPETLFS